LQGDFDFGDLDMNSAEAGFAAAVLLMILLLLFLCCCCCGRGGGGCSLWDLVALACLWEICFDRNGTGGGVRDSFVMMQ
jgi:hypothetical protein